MIDAHSKWIEAVSVPSTSSAATIKVLRNLFTAYDIPDLIISDDGTFLLATSSNSSLIATGFVIGHQHLITQPRTAWRNEWFKSSNPGCERIHQVTWTLHWPGSFSSIATYHMLLLVSHPRSSWLGRKPRTHLDLLHPDLATRVERKQETQRSNHDNQRQERSFKVSDAVLVRNFHAGNKWLPGIVVYVLSPQSLKVKVVRRHLDHVRSRQDTSDMQPTVVLLLPMDGTLDLPSSASTSAKADTTSTDSSSTDTALVPSEDVRRSSRQWNPPSRYSPGRL